MERPSWEVPKVNGCITWTVIGITLWTIIILGGIDLWDWVTK